LYYSLQNQIHDLKISFKILNFTEPEKVYLLIL
jgi:hypothetical protein